MPAFGRARSASVWLQGCLRWRLRSGFTKWPRGCVHGRGSSAVLVRARPRFRWCAQAPASEELPSVRVRTEFQRASSPGALGQSSTATLGLASFRFIAHFLTIVLRSVALQGHLRGHLQGHAFRRALMPPSGCGHAPLAHPPPPGCLRCALRARVTDRLSSPCAQPRLPCVFSAVSTRCASAVVSERSLRRGFGVPRGAFQRCLPRTFLLF